jgi:hypothetical protein
VQVQRAARAQPGRRQARLLRAGAPRVRQPLPRSPASSVTGWRDRSSPAPQCPVHISQVALCASEPCGAPATAVAHAWPECLRQQPTSSANHSHAGCTVVVAGRSDLEDTGHHQLLTEPLTRLCADELVLSVPPVCARARTASLHVSGTASRRSTSRFVDHTVCHMSTSSARVPWTPPQRAKICILASSTGAMLSVLGTQPSAAATQMRPECS